MSLPPPPPPPVLSELGPVRCYTATSSINSIAEDVNTSIIGQSAVFRASNTVLVWKNKMLRFILAPASEHESRLIMPSFGEFNWSFRHICLFVCFILYHTALTRTSNLGRMLRNYSLKGLNPPNPAICMTTNPVIKLLAVMKTKLGPFKKPKRE